MATAMAPPPNHIHQMPPQQPYPQPPQNDYARVVADQFVQQYYKVLRSYANHLHRFYMEDSSLTISGKDGLNESRTASGASIQNLVMEHLPGAQAEYHNFEAQLVRAPGYAVQEPVYYNSTPILIQVSGSLTVGGKDYSFVQTFFLAPFGGVHKGSGYYVANDILRLAPTFKPEAPKSLENGFMPVTAPPSLDAVVDKPAEISAPSSVPQPAAAPVFIPDPAAQPITQPKAASPQRPAPTPQITPPQQPPPATPSQPAAPVAPPAVAAPAPPTSPVRVSQQAPPPAPASPVPAPPAVNLTYAERVKLNMAAAAKAAAAASAAQQAAKPAAVSTAPPAAASQRPGSAPAEGDATKPETPAAGSDHEEAPSTSVTVQDLPDVSVEEVLAEFQKFGVVKGGTAGISIKPYKDRFTAHVDFETKEAVEAACEAEIVFKEVRVKVIERRPYGPRVPGKGRPGKAFGGSRGGERRDSFSSSRRPPTAGAQNGNGERGTRGGRGGYHGENRGEGGMEGPRSESRGDGRGSRGRHGASAPRGRAPRGRSDRQSEGPRAPSPAVADA